MNALVFLGGFAIALSVLSALLSYILYPLALLILSSTKRKDSQEPPLPVHPAVSLIIAAHRAEKLIAAKLENSLSLSYPPENYEIIVFWDGLAGDEPLDIVRPFLGERVRFLSSEEHQGKNRSVNAAVSHCSGEILVFSDVDAILEVNAIENLTKHFSDPEIGGVRGQGIISENVGELSEPQNVYFQFEHAIRVLESKVGSVSSNDGKLYAMRKSLFEPLPPDGADDIFNILSVVKEGRRFVFEPKAKFYKHIPARGALHEIQRRRRIVARSLRSIYLRKGVLNPLKYGFFSLSLFVNKVLRRIFPVLMILLFLSSVFLSSYSVLVRGLLLLQLAFYCLALSHVALSKIASVPGVTRIASLAFYFCIGNYGTLLGLFDFLQGRQKATWKPVKGDR